MVTRLYIYTYMFSIYISIAHRQERKFNTAATWKEKERQQIEHTTFDRTLSSSQFFFFLFFLSHDSNTANTLRHAAPTSIYFFLFLSRYPQYPLHPLSTQPSPGATSTPSSSHILVLYPSNVDITPLEFFLFFFLSFSPLRVFFFYFHSFLVFFSRSLHSVRTWMPRERSIGEFFILFFLLLMPSPCSIFAGSSFFLKKKEKKTLPFRVFLLTTGYNFFFCLVWVFAFVSGRYICIYSWEIIWCRKKKAEKLEF